MRIFFSKLVIGCWLLAGCKTVQEGIELTFTETQLMEKLAEKFPKEEKIYGVVPVVIEKPIAEFVDGEERIRLHLTARVEVPFKGSYEAFLKFSAGIIFDDTVKALQITNIEVEGLEATNLPKKYEPALTILSTVLAQKYLEGHEVYRLKETDFKKKTVRFLLKDVRIQDKKLIVRLGL